MERVPHKALQLHGSVLLPIRTRKLRIWELPSSIAHDHSLSSQALSSQPQMAAPNNSDLGSEPKPQVIYRCKKCRRIVASQEHVVPHERGEGQKCFKWRKRSGNPGKNDKELPECSSIFVEPMKWMEAVQDGGVEEKIQCMGCKARLGSFNWAGMQCNCGAWVNPAFQLHKNRIDECQI